MHHRDAACFQQRLKVFMQINILAGTDRNINRVLQSSVKFGILPRQGVLHPGNIVFFNPFCQLDAFVYADVANMINGQRYVSADDTTHFCAVLFKPIKAFSVI